MVKARLLLAVAGTSLFSVTCAAADIVPRVIDRAEAVRIEAEVRPHLDLTTVVVARLSIGAEPFEVTSLFPAFVPAETNLKTDPARTWFWFTPERDVLNLLTLSGKAAAPAAGASPSPSATGDGGYLLAIPVNEMKNGFAIKDVPVAQADGTIRKETITVRGIRRKP